MNKKDSSNKPNHPQMPTAIIAQHYSSPLPPPEALAKYEQIQRGLVQKIIEMTEAQGNHRRELETKHLKAQIWDVRFGQIFAFIIAITAILAGTYAVLHGYQAAGGIISAIGIGGIVTAFINGRQSAR